jgi:hypothetical protein
MSLSLATTWVNATIRQPAPRADALRLLERAATEGVEGTLIVGPHLTISGKCFLARWDGRELVVRELTRAQQQDWSIKPQGLFQELRQPALPQAPYTTEPLVSLTIAQIENAGAHDGWTPLSGICVAEYAAAPYQVIRNCALRAEYFRPDLRRPITSMWYSDRDLNATQSPLHFRLSPLFSKRNPQTCRGTLVVFFQLFAADDWSANAGCRRISNVVDSVVTLR